MRRRLVLALVAELLLSAAVSSVIFFEPATCEPPSLPQAASPREKIATERKPPTVFNETMLSSLLADPYSTSNARV